MRERTLASTASRQSIPRTPQREALAGGQGKSLVESSQFPLQQLSACACILPFPRTVLLLLDGTVLLSSEVRTINTSLLSIARVRNRVPAHALRVQSGWPRWRELSHAPVRDKSCCGTVGATCDDIRDCCEMASLGVVCHVIIYSNTFFTVR